MFTHTSEGEEMEPSPKAPNGAKLMWIAILALGALALLMTVVSPSKAPKGAEKSALNTPGGVGTIAPSPNPVSTPVAAVVPKSPWEYSNSESEMGLGAIHFAMVTSTNTVSFGFPYQGEQHGTITLRTHPQYGKDVIFGIVKGQILGNSWDGCNVLVRFDDEKPINMSAGTPKDHGTTTIFIHGYQTFVAKLKKAKRLRVQVPVYHEGSPVFDFDVSGLEWPPRK